MADETLICKNLKPDKATRGFNIVKFKDFSCSVREQAQTDLVAYIQQQLKPTLKKGNSKFSTVADNWNTQRQQHVA